MATNARQRFYQFYLPSIECSELDQQGSWNGTGYDFFTEISKTVKEMSKEIGDKKGYLMGVPNEEMELRQSIIAAKEVYIAKIKRGCKLLQLLGENDCSEEILDPRDRLAIRAYRSSVKPQKAEK